MQCQLAIAGIFILTTGCIYSIVSLTKKLIQGSKNFKFKQKHTVPVEWIKIELIKMKKFLRIFKRNPR